MLELSYTKSGVGLLENGFLACPSKMGAWAKLALHRPIRGVNMSHAYTLLPPSHNYIVICLKNLSQKNTLIC